MVELVSSYVSSKNLSTTLSESLLYSHQEAIISQPDKLMKTHFKTFFCKHGVLPSRLNGSTCLLWGVFCPQGFGGLDCLLNCYCARRCQLARSHFQIQRGCPESPFQVAKKPIPKSEKSLLSGRPWRWVSAGTLLKVV